MKKSSILFCLVCLLFVSCSNFSNNKSVETHFPFKENPRDKWGLVDANGKILVANEFKNQPSTVINGMFFVQQDKGYEMYSVKNPLLPIGETYKNIAPFTEDITPAVKEGEGIKYIDKKGHVKIRYCKSNQFYKWLLMRWKKGKRQSPYGHLLFIRENVVFPRFQCSASAI